MDAPEGVTAIFAEPSGWLAGMAAGGAFAIAAVSWFILSNLAAEDREMIGGKEAQRLWRVYSVLAATFISTGCALLYYALFARYGVGQSFKFLGRGAETFLGWLLFALGFVLLPVFLAEFALARISVDVGFTEHYEINFFPRLPGGMKTFYRNNPESNTIFGSLVNRLGKLGIWLLIYVLSSAFGVQLYWNWRKRLQHDDSAWRRILRLVSGDQFWVDVHVMTSLITVGAIMYATVFTDADFGIMRNILVAYVATVYFYFLFFVTFVLNASKSIAGWTRFWIFLTGTIYFALLILDMLGHRISEQQEQLSKLYSIVGQPTNGLLPWYLLMLGIILGARFFEDWLSITRIRKEFLEKQLGQLLLRSTSVDMAARLVHRVGNRLQAPLGALGAVVPELKSLAEQGNARCGILWESAQVGLGSLQGLKKELEDFKQGTRLAHTTDWLDAAVTLKEIAGEVGLAESDILSPSEIRKMEILTHAQDYKETLRNLLNNADYAAQKSQPPRFAIRLTYLPESPYPLRIEIFDNGEGFNADFRDHIFLPYYSTKAEGSGLGMFLAQTFMANMQGKIRAESRQAGDSLTDAPDWVQTRFILDFPTNRVKFT
ncbi:MAG: hypothetical protein KGZ83_02270 [Sulfuricella sp.]|nr:hypothetical protein [Sulfuricella sp.]